MQQFLKPTKAKLILAIIIFALFTFLGSSHVQICKLPPCDDIAWYSMIIIYITLWPFFILPHSLFWQIVVFILWVFYYYLIAGLWFYRKTKYIILIIGIIVMLLSIYQIFVINNLGYGPQLGRPSKCNGLDEQPCMDDVYCLPVYEPLRTYGPGLEEHSTYFSYCVDFEEKYADCPALAVGFDVEPEYCRIK